MNNQSTVSDTLDDAFQLIMDDLLAHALGKGPKATENRRILYDNIDTTLFTNEDYVIYLAMYGLRNKGDNKPTINLEYLNVYLTLHLDAIGVGRKKGYITNIEMLNDTDDPNVAYIAEVLKQYQVLSANADNEDMIYDANDYLLKVQEFLELYASITGKSAFLKARDIIMATDGNGKNPSGVQDAFDFARKEINRIETIINPDNGKGYVDAEDIDIFSDIAKPQHLANFDLLPILNDKQYLGGIYSDMFYNILAPTKGGKSKFCTRMVHSVLINGHNVTVWPYEGGIEMFLAQLYVVHAEWLNRDEANGKKTALTGGALNQRMVLSDDYLLTSKDKATEEDIKKAELIKSKVLYAKEDLINSGRYGHLNFIDKPLKLENFSDSLIEGIKVNNNSKMVMVDYLQLISSESNKLAKNQVISIAYQEALAFAKKYHCCFVSPSQMKQETMTALANLKEGENFEMRTAAGESAEVVRTPDVNIGLYATEADLSNRIMKIVPFPSRISNLFPRTNIHHDLGLCLFSQIKE